MDIKTNLAYIQENIRKACEKTNRDLSEITIIGVTKYVTIERTIEAMEAGVHHFGENRAEGLLEKYNHIDQPAKWHFIGTLQTRKVKDIIDKVEAIHSLDRESLAKQINNRANRVIDCFVQVNVSEEESKHGLAVADVIPFVELLAAYENIRVVGLMTMAPHVSDEEVLRKTFKDLAQLRDVIMTKNYAHAPCKYLSMGMSNDYEIAVEEGATHIRVGSKLVEE